MFLSTQDSFLGYFFMLNYGEFYLEGDADEPENFKEIHDKLQSLLANQDDPRLDRQLGYRLVAIEE